MAKVHFLNVGEGDCTIIQHNNASRVTMIDMCCGNKSYVAEAVDQMLKSAGVATKADSGGNFNMADYPTKPQDYLRKLKIDTLWRFILSHPDMDHMDGFNALMDEFSVNNFWHMGAKREKPDFSRFGRYKEEDWDRYVKVRDGKESGTKSLHVLAGKRFEFANQGENGSSGGDGLHILAPTQQLVDLAHETGDFNDCSFVLLYRTGDHRIIFAGDSHDETWDHILENYRSSVENCDVLIAPHHGRDSGRSWEFLNVVKPKLTLFGIAKSDHLAYAAWNNRKLPFITNNQAGNVILEVSSSGHLCVYVENEPFAEKRAPLLSQYKNDVGYSMVDLIPSKSQAAV